MSETSPKPFVFVLMPFDSNFDDIYQLGIKPACSEAGAYAERVDEQEYDERILDRIYNQIAKADLVVADMTGQNPNVFYETGYAHALDKRVILLTQKTDDIPFDLKHHPHIVYDGKITNLKDELYKRVKWAIENPKKDISNLGLQLQFVVNNVKILDNPVVDCSDHNEQSFYLSVDIHNSVEKEIRKKSFQMALITPKSLESVSYKARSLQLTKTSCIPISNEEGYIHLFEEDLDLLPGSWLTEIVFHTYSNRKLSEGNMYQLTLRIFSSGLPADYHFKIKILQKE